MGNTKSISGLQVARGIAALLIVLFHTDLNLKLYIGQNELFGFWNFGLIGVDFFFVLSGFIIYWVYSSDKRKEKSIFLYIKKRIIRIYPPYLIITFALLVAYNVFPTFSNSGRNISVLASLFLIPSESFSPALIVSWTLMHELLFYFVFITFLISTKYFRIVSFLWAGLILVLNLSSSLLVKNILYLNPYNLEFLFGIIAAIIVKKQKSSLLHLIFGFSILILFVCIHNGDFGKNIYFNGLFTRVVLGTCFMLIITGLYSIESKVRYSKALIFFGTASYSIFLIHSPIISILIRLAAMINSKMDIHPVVIFLIIIVFCILSGITFFLLIEKSIHKFFDNVFATR